MRRLVIGVLTLHLFFGAPSASAQVGVGSPNMRHVAHQGYTERWGMVQPFGTDIEFARIAGRDYALAGTYRNGLQIIDITNPRRPRIAETYDCAIAQGDVQVFRRGSRTLVTYTADGSPSNTFPESGCYQDMGIRTDRYGTFIVDVSNPKRPTTVGFIDVPKGSHNQSVHPSGRYMYNSNSDSRLPSAVEVIDITNPAKPRRLADLPLLTGFESHDITFSADGSRAYIAALSHTLIADTSDPAHPEIIGRILDQTLDLHHQADPITITDPILGERTFLVITDELFGAGGNGFCPGGGLHVFDVTGELERAPVKVGYWNMPEVRATTDNDVCTSHVLRFYPEHKLMTIAWYDAGVRVLDVSGLAGISAGVDPNRGGVGAGMREIGYYTMPNAHTWSAKTNRIEPDGSFYLFANDVNRGLDVYRFDAKAPQSGSGGTWLTPDELAVSGGTMRPPACVLRLADGASADEILERVQ